MHGAEPLAAQRLVKVSFRKLRDFHESAPYGLRLQEDID
jgi:hypothetical protein